VSKISEAFCMNQGRITRFGIFQHHALAEKTKEEVNFT
jgi:hypothetical protein